MGLLGDNQHIYASINIVLGLIHIPFNVIYYLSLCEHQQFQFFEELQALPYRLF